MVLIQARNRHRFLILNYKPTFEDMYKHISTDMIEMTKGYDLNILIRKDGM